MNKIIVLGSVGIDSITTPYSTVRDVLGGSAVYASLAAAKFAAPFLVSVVGKDFPDEMRDFLRQPASPAGGQGIALDGLVSVNAPTFRWEGKYQFDMGVAKTLKTELGSMEKAAEVTKGYEKLLKVTNSYPKFLLLANFDPEIQAEIARQFREFKVTGLKFKSKFLLLDTMNFWIEKKIEKVKAVIKRVDALVLNENEARQLFNTPNLIKAGHLGLEAGPEYIIIKKGEHGAMLFSPQGFFAVPGYPLLSPIDPTGAGDSFAGSLIGYLASEKLKVKSENSQRIDFKMMRQALVYAVAVSSFTVEGMGPSRLAQLKTKEIEERVEVFREMREF